MKTDAKWLNKYKILDSKDIPDLEYAAAIHEFGNGLARPEAEAAAHKEYAEKHHKDGAAFHLRGMRAAQAAGDWEQSAKHGQMYGLHMGALNLDPMDKVPADILSLVDAEDKPTAYRFKANKADTLVLPGLPGKD